MFGLTFLSMHLDLMRSLETEFPQVDAAAIRSLRVWHCKFSSLDALSRFKNLRILVVASWPDDSFDRLASLTELRYLSVVHFPGVGDLTPLASLKSMHTLSLQSLPSWDSSGKVQEVATLRCRSVSPLLRGPLPGLGKRYGRT